LRASGNGDADRDAACGYESLGGLLLRVDAVENLLGTAHSLARQGQLHANAALARIPRCGPEALPAVLIALGFEKAGDGFRARDSHQKPRRSGREHEIARDESR
jgi:hypothetical protein